MYRAKDLIYFADFRARLDDKSVLVIHAGTALRYMENALVSARVDGGEAGVTAVPVINMRSMLCYSGNNPLFDCEYQFMIKVPPDFGKAELTVCFGGEYGDTTYSYTVSGSTFRKQLSGVSASVDGVEHDGGILRIKGWCAADGPVRLSVKEAGGCRIERVFRADVADYYQEGELKENAGFIIELPSAGVRKLHLVMETDRQRTVKSVPVSGEISDKQYGLWQKLVVGMDYLRQRGFSAAVSRLRRQQSGKGPVSRDFEAYDEWIRAREADGAELERQRQVRFDREPLFSVIVPVYRPKKKFFEEMLESVKNQTYQKWELCIADGSGEGFFMEESVREVFGGDSRIKYKALSDNKGISGNTNEAMELACGDYIVLADHDDIIRPDALFECARVINGPGEADIIYTDEDKLDTDTGKRFSPHFKPDFNPYLLKSCNYITHLFVYSAKLAKSVGGFDSACDGSQDYDMILRCTEKAQDIRHIPKILYSWRCHDDSTAQKADNKGYAQAAGVRALQGHYKRLGIDAKVTRKEVPGYYAAEYALTDMPLISIIIPNKDSTEDLEKCLSSLLDRQDYDNYEVLIVENNSTEAGTFEYYRELEGRDSRIRMLYYEGEFNFAAINNFAVKQAKGEYLLFLNNDTRMIRTDCLRQLVSFGLRPEVGAVGARLFYDDGTVQHAGVIIGISGVAGHAFAGMPRDGVGYFARAVIAQNYSAVTAACMLVRCSVYDEVGGFEEELKVDFNDVDFCLKIREKGHLIVYNPAAELYHYESKSRGRNDTPEKHARYNREIAYMRSKWRRIYEEGDPYYNPNLTLLTADFSLKE